MPCAGTLLFKHKCPVYPPWPPYGYIFPSSYEEMNPYCRVTTWMHHLFQLWSKEVILHGHNMDAPFISAMQERGHPVWLEWPQYGCSVYFSYASKKPSCMAPMATIWMQRSFQLAGKRPSCMATVWMHPSFQLPGKRPSCMATVWMHRSFQLCRKEANLYGHNMNAPFFSAMQQRGHPIWLQYACTIITY